jgi:hypothetical protein
MATSKKPMTIDNGPPPRIKQLLDDYGIVAELGGAYRNLNPRQKEIARRSAAYRALMRSSVENPGFDDLHSLTAIWQRVGSPAGKSPADWLAEGGGGSPDAVIEDRREAGIFADWESAGWYAHHLDPENFDVAEVVEQLY